jgi:transposase
MSPEQASFLPAVEPDSIAAAVFAKEAPRAGGAGRAARPRVVYACRDQVELRPCSLDELVAADHRVRQVWAFVRGLDLSPLYERIEAVEGAAGRSATDPAIFMALWLYATNEGIGSARLLARLCEESIPYRWLCGGVSVNYHTLSDFRTDNLELVNGLLSECVAAMMVEGLVDLERVAIDGMRVRASAGAASFRRRPTLEQALTQARAHVEALAQELEADPSSCSRREAAARQRAARERDERVEAALQQMSKIEAKKAPKDKDKARVSTTDAEARVMKMGDGGYRPAFNAELATDTQSGVIVGASLINSTDMGQLAPMIEQIRERYARAPAEALADGGFAKKEDITRLSEPDLNCRVFVPVQVSKSEKREAHQAHALDTPAVAQWRARMATEEAKTIYRERAASAEWVNAQARNHGLIRFLVRGLRKAFAALLWHVLAHNMQRYYALRRLKAQTAG